MNRSELRQAVRDRIGVPSADGVLTDDVLNRFIERALQRFAAAHDWWWLEATVGSSTSSATIALSLDFQRIINVTMTDRNVVLKRASIDTIDMLDAATGDPCYYAQVGTDIIVAPAPDSSQPYQIRYLRSEITMNDDVTDARTPDVFIDPVIELAASLALRQVSQSGRADEAMNAYERMTANLIDRASAESPTHGGAHTVEAGHAAG